MKLKQVFLPVFRHTVIVSEKLICCWGVRLFYARFEVFTVIKSHVMVFWFVTQCSGVIGYHNVRIPCISLWRRKHLDPPKH